MLQNAKTLFVFFKHHSGVSWLFTVLGCALYAYFGDAAQQASVKLAVTGFYLYIVFSFRQSELFYYYNLHVSKRALALGYYFFDMLFFYIAIYLTHQLLHLWKA